MNLQHFAGLNSGVTLPPIHARWPIHRHRCYRLPARHSHQSASGEDRHWCSVRSKTVYGLQPKPHGRRPDILKPLCQPISTGHPIIVNGYALTCQQTGHIIDRQANNSGIRTNQADYEGSGFTLDGIAAGFALPFTRR